MKIWLVITYKTNESKVLQRNLDHQNFEYYLPKILVISEKTQTKTEKILFPGYAFVYCNLDDYSALKYSKGVRKVLIFGNSIPSISDTQIKKIKEIEQNSRISPIEINLKVGDQVKINDGPFKDVITQIISFPSNERVGVLLTILGSSRLTQISSKIVNKI